MPDGLQSKRAPRHASAFRAYSTKVLKSSAVLSWQRGAFASYMRARGTRRRVRRLSSLDDLAKAFALEEPFACDRLSRKNVLLKG